MGLWDSIKNAFTFSPATNYVVDLQTAEFLESAHFEPALDSDDMSHKLVLNFQEPIRDGNEIRYLNLRNEEGSIVFSDELFAGSKSYSPLMNPEGGALDAVFVDNDGNAVYTDSIIVSEEIVE